MIQIPIRAGWKPDLSPEDILKVGGLRVCKNVMPVNNYYEPISDKVTFNNNATTGTILNGFCTQNTDGEYINFVGTSSKLYRFNNSTLIDVTRSIGGDYTAQFWNFAEYGNWTIATNYYDDIQVIKDYDGGKFQSLGGSPPKAKFCLMSNSHLVLGFLRDGLAKYPKKIIWSARENPEDWTPSLVTGAGSQNLPDIAGNITGLGAFGENFIIASENSISVAYFTGTRSTFDFQINAVKNMGCFYPQSFISIGNAVFFWGRDSIYMFNGQINDIGRYIRKTIMNSINIEYTDKITVAHDKNRKLIIWAYPSISSTGLPDRLLIYNYEEDKWSYATLDVASIFMAATGGILINDMNMLIDDINILMDSNYWMNNNIMLLVGDTDNKIKTLSGTQLTTEIETGEFSSENSVLKILKAYIPSYALTGSGQVIVKHRKSVIDDTTSSNASSIKSDGSVDLRISNKRLALNIQLSGYEKLGNEISADGIEVAKR